MKQLLFGAALAVLFLSCTNDEEQTSMQTSEQQARFGWQVVQEGVMTRAVQTTDAQAHLCSLMPSDADFNGLKIYEVATQQELSINLGASYRLRTGQYAIDYKYERALFKYDDVHLSGFPVLRIRHEWEIVNGISEYTLPARYECCAIVWDGREAALEINAQSTEPNIQQQTGDIKAVFLTDIDAEQTYTFTLTPSNTDEYRTTTWEVTGAKLTAGHYYVLQCNNKYQQSAHLIAFDDMEQGEL